MYQNAGTPLLENKFLIYLWNLASFFFLGGGGGGGGNMQI